MSVMRRILGKATFTCKRITELTETMEVVKLSPIDKFKYKLHLFLCKVCRSYVKQSKLIEKAIGRMFGASEDTEKGLDESTKQKILDRLKKREE